MFWPNGHFLACSTDQLNQECVAELTKKEAELYKEALT
jgi:hypothetical protein